jgi:hypothetical protein
MIWTKRRIIKEFGIARSLVPVDEEIFEDEIAYGRCDDRRALFLPTARRLIISQVGFLWGRKITDFSGGKFKQLKINEGWASSTIELEYRGQDRVLKLEGLNREQIRNFYRRARGRVTKYNNKYQISSRICPECREIISFYAKQCPHCHSELTSDPELF